jgi:NAD(P)-dependent dehydrogenase (short-subunit alcohol dehydrogenase family)
LANGCVVVTGASRGIGAAIAVALARCGFTVACLSRSGEAPQIADAGPELTSRWAPQRCDVTNSDSVSAAFAALQTAVGVPIVGLVNNAGVHLQGPSESFSLSDYDRVMSTNATSIFRVSQVAFPYLKASQGSLIVNIGSFYDKLGVKGNLAYCASKAAVAAMTRCLAVEWAKIGIRVLNVAPGYIVTDLNREEISSGPLAAFLQKRIPTSKPGTACEVGELVAALFTLSGGFMTGETLYIDGGQGMAL